jgi:hypothetical protein
MLDEQLYGPHGYDFDMRPFRNPDPRGDPRMDPRIVDPRIVDPRIDPRMTDPRMDTRPPPSYAVAVRCVYCIFSTIFNSFCFIIAFVEKTHFNFEKRK